jgi:O-antigen/teichoic acid export membrane protein
MSEGTDIPRRSAGRTIARNTLFGIGAQIALRVVSFVFQILVVRALGGNEYGQYTIVTAWAGLFAVIGDLGINQYLAREIARDPSKSDELFWDTVVLRFFLAIVCAIITVGSVIAFTDYSREIIIAVAVYTSSYFLQIILAPMDSILRGNERLDILAIFGVVSQVLFMVLAGLFLYAGLGFVWLVIASVLNLPIMIGLHFGAIRRNHLQPPRFKINPALWWSVIRYGIPFGITQLSLSLAFRVDTIVLSSYVSDYDIGLYNVAYINLTLTLIILAQSFNQAITPTLSREYAQNPDSVLPWYYQAVKMMLFLGLPIAIGGMLTADKIIGIYQSEIAPAALLLAMLVWDIPLVLYHSFCGNMAVSVKREGDAARIFALMGILNLLLNLFLIPRFGVIGAVFTTLITDIFGVVQFYFLFRHAFGAGLGFTKLIRIVIAAGVMGILVFVLRDLNFFILVALAGAVYLPLVWVSGAFTREERSRLVGFVAKRLPLPAQRIIQHLA